MKHDESVVLVDSKGVLRGCARRRSIPTTAVCAVALTLLYSPDRRVVVLLRRGKGATDMVGRWSLHAGKVRSTDLASADRIGSLLSLEAVRNAALRELSEELALTIHPQQLTPVDRYFMPHREKSLFFALLSLPLSGRQLDTITPNPDEVADLGFFTPAQLFATSDLGDALVYRRERIIKHLSEVLAHRGPT
jgi:8-oxo-dGTP pyrophosphatase MutT (NUDIX family)